MADTALKLYGIAQCDRVRAARAWLDAQGLTYQFIDFRRDGLEPARVSTWLERLGAEALINRRGKTWRELSEAERAVTDPSPLTELLCRQPLLMRRPILETPNGGLHCGFSTDDYARLCHGH